MDPIETLRAQLSALTDKQAVYEVLLRIARGVDRYDAELLAASIHPDAVMDMGGEQSVSGAAFAAALKPPARLPAGRMHLIGNHAIEVDGDRASAESYVLSCQELGEDDHREIRLRAGRYLDCFARREGVWKLSHRVFVDEWARTDPVRDAPAKGRHRGRPAPDDLAYRPPEAP